MDRQLHRCDGCGMELYLLGPATRPCPSCGGTFRTMDFNAMLSSVVDSRKSQAAQIEEYVEKAMPDIISGFEELLAKRGT